MASNLGVLVQSATRMSISALDFDVKQTGKFSFILDELELMDGRTGFGRNKKNKTYYELQVTGSCRGQ